MTCFEFCEKGTSASTLTQNPFFPCYCIPLGGIGHLRASQQRGLGGSLSQALGGLPYIAASHAHWCFGKAE